MNHCLLEVEVLEAPQVRYTQDNQTPVAEMAVQIDGLRPDDPPGQLKVVGWGNLAQELQNRVQVGQRLMLEGRLRMNTVTRQDGVKEKRAEFTLARLHPLGAGASGMAAGTDSPMGAPAASASAPPVRRAAGSGMAAAPGGGAPSAAPPSAAQPAAQPPTWNTSPLVPDLPDDDDIPF
ncbi:single-stranded DNA-binding protein [Cyanobium sp. Aljojuca 7D2]|uniref:single-stranded DNA-binding protein n=1 Tax=Cyanobium sp. Aljojuca 7D2 TaxID=2823698 RepID=UPI0020CE6A22|nr:single-stranded DNA-binding protein [Cyanobium sp. Aljojuca 7D2]MCP9891824.1 single-stranded DNA-binding protein [Cyanobium sp. Aljojuca 7D2]